MNILNMVFETGQMFKVLLLCFLTFKAGGVQILTNVSTQINERVNSWYTTDIMNYTIDINRYNIDLTGTTSLVFAIKACGHAHVLLSNYDVRYSSKALYEIGIGYSDDTSEIVFREDDLFYEYASVFILNILNCIVYQPFWISWADGDITLGTGMVVGENVVMNLKTTHHVEVKSIGVFTDEGNLGNWTIQVEVSDKFAGYFDSCNKDNTKSDMVVVDDIKCSKLRCASSCGLSKTCMGFNFNRAINRCELLWFGSNVVSDIPHHIETGWRFYSKCFNRKTACLGCYF